MRISGRHVARSVRPSARTEPFGRDELRAAVSRFFAFYCGTACDIRKRRFDALGFATIVVALGQSNNHCDDGTAQVRHRFPA